MPFVNAELASKKVRKSRKFPKEEKPDVNLFSPTVLSLGQLRKKSFRKGKREKRGRQIFDIKEWKEEIMQAAFVWHGELGKYC